VPDIFDVSQVDPTSLRTIVDAWLNRRAFGRKGIAIIKRSDGPDMFSTYVLGRR
jgi:hypothetical protein